jgi:hypothetical protein
VPASLSSTLNHPLPPCFIQPYTFIRASSLPFLASPSPSFLTCFSLLSEAELSSSKQQIAGLLSQNELLSGRVKGEFGGTAAPIDAMLAVNASPMPDSERILAKLEEITSSVGAMQLQMNGVCVLEQHNHQMLREVHRGNYHDIAGMAIPVASPTRRAIPANMPSVSRVDLSQSAQASEMREPVIAADGISYEREIIEQYIRQRREAGLELRSPTTNEFLPHTMLTPMRRVGDEYSPPAVLRNIPTSPTLSSSLAPPESLLSRRFIPTDPGSLKTANV